MAEAGVGFGDLDGVAATAGPGLIGGVIVGLMTAKALENLRRVVGNSQKVDALAGVYAVVSANDPTIITVAHRNH